MAATASERSAISIVGPRARRVGRTVVTRANAARPAVVGTVQSADHAAVRAAVGSVTQAFAGWRALSAVERAKPLEVLEAGILRVNGPTTDSKIHPPVSASRAEVREFAGFDWLALLRREQRLDGNSLSRRRTIAAT